MARPPSAALDLSRLPRHVAIIMDGNGRWAQQRGLSRIEGHRRGKDSVRAIVETSRRLGMRYLSLFAFSTENWQRPRREVDALMSLLRRYLRTELRKMMKNEVRLLAIGDLQRLPPIRAGGTAVRRRGDAAQPAADGDAGGELRRPRGHRARPPGRLARQARDGDIDPDDIDETRFAQSLSTAGVPDPDLLIRTSGEMRMSNFFLWQLAYTEIYVTDTLWPDFREPEFLSALAHYQQRERRFGRTAEQLDRERLRAAR